MLSDVCSDFLAAVFESGVSPALYDELRASIEGYAQPPFGYPKDVCSTLISALDAMKAGSEEIDSALFTELLLMTLRAYDSASAELEETLGARLLAAWPAARRALQA